MLENAQKHLLILSGPMGNGHIRAAGALEECAVVKYPGLKVTNVNVKDYMTLFQKNFFHDLYLYFANKCPFAWSFVYYNTDRPYPETFLGRLIRNFRKRISKRMMKAVLEYDPDYIICTHFIPAEVLNDYKVEHDYKVPVSVIVTDFSLHWVYINTALEHYFVNCTEVENLLVSRGVEKERIHITGCPVYPEFTRAYPKSEVDSLRRKNGFSTDMNIFLVMMGGNGVGKIHYLCKVLLERFPEYGVIAMAGAEPRKIKALRGVEEEYSERMLTVPFTDEVAQYLAMSDIIVTKPGGISTSECIAMKKPMVIINPIPGQEERNVDYLIERGIIAKAHDEDSLRYREFLPTREYLDYVKEQLEKISLPMAGYDILEIALKDGSVKSFMKKNKKSRM